MASIYIYRDKIYMNIRINGKQIRKSTGLVNNKANRLKVIQEVMPTFISNIGDPNKDVKLEYYIERFLEEKKHITKSITYKRYKLIIDGWIADKYGDKPISTIKHSTAKEYITTQYNLGKSAKTVELYVTVFSGILQEAIYDGTLDANPFKSIKKKKKSKPVIIPFSTDEVKLLLDNTEGWFHNYIGIASHLGMRSGEIVGLQWKDIKNSYIKIRRTRDKVNSEPKTNSSKRDLPIFDSVRPFIESQRELTGHLEYVFNTSYGNPWCNTQCISQGHWYPLLKKLKLKKRRIYELRHTFATNMLNSGFFKVTEIAHLMGHTTTEYLFNVYSKYIESEKSKIPLDKSIY